MAKRKDGTYKGPVEWSADIDVPIANKYKELVYEFKRHALFYGAENPT
jgi:hypothetical protein